MKLPEHAKAHAPIRLDATKLFATRYHLFEKDDLEAIQAALYARRPLILCGEPGTGKSQFAEAAAKVLGWDFKSYVVDAATEPHDLMYTVDLVQRLAKAQLLASLSKEERERSGGVEQQLALRAFTRPGPLWWAFNPQDAGSLEQPKGSLESMGSSTETVPSGAVVLIDEIDKADAAVPNAVLQALADGSFRGPGGETITVQSKSPLVIFSTNGERELPRPFVRRCLVHRLELPAKCAEFVEHLCLRGEVHFENCPNDILIDVANSLYEDRKRVGDGDVLPGLAEYLDYLRILMSEDPPSTPWQLEKRHAAIGKYLFRKHEQLLAPSWKPED